MYQGIGFKICLFIGLCAQDICLEVAPNEAILKLCIYSEMVSVQHHRKGIEMVVKKGWQQLKYNEQGYILTTSVFSLEITNQVVQRCNKLP